MYACPGSQQLACLHNHTSSQAWLAVIQTYPSEIRTLANPRSARDDFHHGLLNDRTQFEDKAVCRLPLSQRERVVFLREPCPSQHSIFATSAGMFPTEKKDFRP